MTAASMRPSPQPSRVNLSSLLTGIAIGGVIATFAWVQVLPNSLNSDEAANQRFVPAAPGDDGGAAVTAEETGGGGRVVRGGSSGDEATEGGAGDATGGLDLGEGATVGAGVGGSGGSGSGCSGGATDTGVSDDKIKLGATVAEDGIADAFLGEVRLGMEAVRTRVNRAGGICGRTLEISYKNDAWNGPRGKTFIENLIKDEKVFALAVSPSSEGVNQASKAGVFKSSKVPVVGADGLNNSQFTDPYIFPVAAATTTQMHVIMKDAWDRAKAAGTELRPAIVFGNTYRFGVEGAFAFNAAYKRLAKQDIPGYSKGETSCKSGTRYCGVNADKDDFTSEASTINRSCFVDAGSGEQCNFMLLLLEPKTALGFHGSFAKDASDFPLGMAGPQPLFTFGFGEQCKSDCDGMVVWTGYNPPIEQYSNQQAVATYVNELQAQSASADQYNQFTMGGYIGMELLVAALEQVGGDLTRERLVKALESMPPLKTGLTNPDGLQWGPMGSGTGARYANHSAQAFRMNFERSFAGWGFEQKYLKDPWLGQDNQV